MTAKKLSHPRTRFLSYFFLLFWHFEYFLFFIPIGQKTGIFWYFKFYTTEGFYRDGIYFHIYFLYIFEMIKFLIWNNYPVSEWNLRELCINDTPQAPEQVTGEGEQFDFSHDPCLLLCALFAIDFQITPDKVELRRKTPWSVIASLESKSKFLI